jgi:hypothetical protein
MAQPYGVDRLEVAGDAFAVTSQFVSSQSVIARGSERGEPTLARTGVARILVREPGAPRVISDDTEVSRSTARRLTRFSSSRGRSSMMFWFSAT